MKNLYLIEEYYKKIINNLHTLIPEGIYFINLELLNRLDLLHFQPLGEYKSKGSKLMEDFQVIESPEKITLINDQFVVWILPDYSNEMQMTYSIIALNPGVNQLRLEAVLIASGIYNNPILVLKALEKFLLEIQETERTLSRLI